MQAGRQEGTTTARASRSTEKSETTARERPAPPSLRTGTVVQRKSPGTDYFLSPLGTNIIGAEGLNGRVRNGNGCGPSGDYHRANKDCRPVRWSSRRQEGCHHPWPALASSGRPSGTWSRTRTHRTQHAPRSPPRRKDTRTGVRCPCMHVAQVRRQQLEEGCSEPLCRGGAGPVVTAQDGGRWGIGEAPVGSSRSCHLPRSSSKRVCRSGGLIPGQLSAFRYTHLHLLPINLVVFEVPYSPEGNGYFILEGLPA